LVSKEADNKEMANAFVDWLMSEDGGQEIARTFTKNGVILYSRAPPGRGAMNQTFHNKVYINL
jgi:ABC-type Fe3+ transport system substrate-binding protein